MRPDPVSAPLSAAESAAAAARRQTLVWLAAAAGAYVAGIVYLFWPAFASGFSRLPGDLGDFRFINVVVEHWYRVALGRSPWRDTLFFHPHPGVLGYSDALFLYAVPYVGFRLARLSAHYAFFCTLVTVLGVGFASTLWLLRRVLGVAWPIAIVATLIYVFSNMMALKIVHPGFYAVAFFPLVVGLLWRTMTAIGKGRPFGVAGVALAVLVPLLLYTSYYMGWFTILLCGLWGLVLLVQQSAFAPKELRAFLAGAWRGRYGLLSLGAVGAAAMVPFVLTHLQPFLENQERGWAQVRSMLPTAVDFINVGAGNPAWSWLAAALVPAGRPLAHELTVGLPPGMIVAFAVACALVAARMAALWRNRDGSVSLRDQAIACLALTVLVCWLLMLRVGDSSLWSLVYTLVPGASAIRGVFRLQMLLHLAILAVVAITLDRAWRARRQRGAVVVVLALLALEQVNFFRTSFDARQETQWLAGVQPPLASCRHFAVAPDGARHTGYTFGPQLDAMMVAEHLGIPTINGYSSHFPPHWRSGLLDLRSPDYAVAAVEWLRRHDLRHGLCLLDLRTGSWWSPRGDGTDLRHVNLVRVEPRSFEEALALELSGFHGLEPHARWTDGYAEIVLARPIASGRLIVAGDVLNPAGSRVRIAAEGETLFDRTLGVGSFRLDLPHAGTVSRIEIASTTFVPKLVGMNADPRRLGIAVKEVAVE